jgi:hypothetical protein
LARLDLYTAGMPSLAATHAAVVWLTPRASLLGDVVELTSGRATGPIVLTHTPPEMAAERVRPRGARTDMRLAVGVVAAISDENDDGRFTLSTTGPVQRPTDLAVATPDRLVGVSETLLLYAYTLPEWQTGLPTGATGLDLGALLAERPGLAILGFNAIQCNVKHWQFDFFLFSPGFLTAIRDAKTNPSECAGRLW